MAIPGTDHSCVAAGLGGHEGGQVPVTDDDPDVEYVVARELRLLNRRIRRSREDAAELLDPEFRGFGASGRIWDRESVLDMMSGEDFAPAESRPPDYDVAACGKADYRTAASSSPRRCCRAPRRMIPAWEAKIHPFCSESTVKA